MKDLLLIKKITKQALWKDRQRKKINKLEEITVVDLIKLERISHPRMGCRKIYYRKQKESPVGRDKFESIGFSNGYKVKTKRNPIRTTLSQDKVVYPNLIEGKMINNINQVWQSDIFYLNVEGTEYYGVTIMDVYSRELLALVIGETMKAEQLVKAMYQAIKYRKGDNLTGCIFHSDRGSQYISNIHLAVIEANGFLVSMCKVAQENAYVERIQGTLKNEYLKEWPLKISNIQQFASKLKKLYNDERPHESLQMLTPTRYAQLIRLTAKKDRPEMEIYQWTHPLLTLKGIYQQKEKRSKKEKVDDYKTKFNRLKKVNQF